MTQQRPRFSVCIPAYNRAKYLAPLLDSVLSQDFHDYEILICEDRSPERQEIAQIAREYANNSSQLIRYHENEQNLGYDANIRNLIHRANGEFCFFLGNDDLMAPGALAHAEDILARYDNVGLILRSYGIFRGTPDNLVQVIRYFDAERAFSSGRDSIAIAFRRSGVIAGYTINRDAAEAAATSRFDGTLFYQMHLTSTVLTKMRVVFSPQLLVWCRDGEAPDFGHSTSEKGKYVPGTYTAAARVSMVAGALSIVRDLKGTTGIDLVDEVTRDYANYFYPYVRDQLNLPFREYAELYKEYGKLGLARYPMFHLHCWLAYALGTRTLDWVIERVRGVLGRSPHLGWVR